MASETKVPRSIKLSNELNSTVNDYLKVSGQSFNSFVNSAVQEKIEDDTRSTKILTSAIESNKNEKRYSLDDVKRELGI
ncbi:hypothetical protein AKUH4B205J_TOXIN200100 (plasmid) [Apilactobacillus kunkeei]|nr:hypothetical protein AKUH4B205J_TOXIN200100 [Apilactobacillus kunkeei]